MTARRCFCSVYKMGSSVFMRLVVFNMTAEWKAFGNSKFIFCFKQASYRVHEMCSADIKKYDCHNQVAVGVNDGTDVVGLSSVLLCLENKKLNGSKSSAKSPCTTILILIVTQQFAYYLTLYTLSIEILLL